MRTNSPNTMPLRAPLLGSGMTRPNAAAALESAAKARSQMQAAQAKGAAQGNPAPKPAAPAPAPQVQPKPAMQAPAAQPGKAPVQYPNPEWNPRAEAARQMRSAPPPMAMQKQPVAPMAVNLPAGYAPPPQMGGNPMASMVPAAPAGKPGFEVPVKLPPTSPINDPSAWTDATSEMEAAYGTQGEQQAGQQQSQEGQYAIDTYYGGDAMAYYQDQIDQAQTPEEQAAAEAALAEFMTPGLMMGDMDLGALLGGDSTALAGLNPEGWSDTAALAGLDEGDWANENNPGPGFAYNPDTGKWEQDALPSGVSADDPRWGFNEETGQWQLHDYEKDGALLGSRYLGEKTKGAIESSVEDHMNPYLDEQKKEAWDQAQAANYQVAQTLGARGIGASGLTAMGMGDVFAATQANVQGMDFDAYGQAAELRLNEIRTLLAGNQGVLTVEAQKELAAEAAKLEKDLAQMQYAREDKDNIWTDIDNHAAAFEKEAKNGWDSASLSAYRAWASTPGNDLYKSVIFVDEASGKIYFDKEKSQQAMKEAGFTGGGEPVDPAEVGFEDWWLDTPESAYDNYYNNAKSVGATPMSYYDFATWVWETYQIQLPGGGIPSNSSQSKEDDPDWSDAEGAPPGMTPEEQAAWFEDEDDLEGNEDGPEGNED